MPAQRKPRLARRKPRSTAAADRSLNFTALVASIRQVHEHCATSVNRTINTTLTRGIGPLALTSGSTNRTARIGRSMVMR
jgi:hypothetical protein